MSEPIFAQPRVVAFQEIDPSGILSVPRLFEYFHDAYFALLASHGIDVPAVLRERRWGSPVGSAEADFRAPLRYGDRVVVEVVRGDVGRSSLAVHFRVRAQTQGDESRVVCTGKIVHVFIDRETFRPRAVVDEVRAIFAESSPG